MKKKPTYQTVYLELENGKVGAFYGTVLVKKEKEAKIVSVSISSPTELRPDILDEFDAQFFI